MQRTAASDAGFDRKIFAEMLGTLNRLTDDGLAIGVAEAASLRAYYREWATDLMSASN